MSTVIRPNGFIKSGIRASSVTTRIVRAYENADASARIDGSIWYENAAIFADKVATETDTQFETVAAVISALSPQLPWSKNMEAARRICIDQTHTAGVLGANHRQALECFSSCEPVSKLTGPKRYSFVMNILGDTDMVTVDSWAFRVALGFKLDYDKMIKRVGMYRDITTAYRNAALIVGETPRELQAITWCAIRGKSV